MADISYKYRDNEHSIDSYDNVVSTYEWISDALRFVFDGRIDLTLNCVIAFDSEDMSYECGSIDEFKKYAFGKTIRVKTMTAYISENWFQTLVSIYANHLSGLEQQEFILSSKDEMMVIGLRDALLTKKKSPPRPQPSTVIQCEDNSVHIGDGNKISNSTIGPKNTIETEREISNSAPEKGKLVSKIFWQILIPVAVVAIGALVCTWLGIDTQ